MSKWTQKPPTRPGIYWQWSGKRADKPRPLAVERHRIIPGLRALVREDYLASSVAVNVIGGWWMPAELPKTPKVSKSRVGKPPSPSARTSPRP